MSIDIFAPAPTKRSRRDRPGRILTIDIERLPGLAYAFDQKTKFISHRNFVQQPRTICWAARWLGQSRVLFESTWKDEQRMVDRAWELFDEADAVVTFNGDRFDIPHLQGEWAKAGYAPPRPYKSIDLYKMARNKFGFISNSLDHMTRQLGYTGKLSHYSIEVAQAAVDGDKEAQKNLRTYNAGDIELTEWLHERLLGWLPTHPHMKRSTEISCNQCGGENLHKQPTRYRAVLLEYELYRCQDCGGFVRTNWETKRVATTRGVR